MFYNLACYSFFIRPNWRAACHFKRSEINVVNQLELLAARRPIQRLMTQLAAQKGAKSDGAAFVAIADKIRLHGLHAGGGPAAPAR